MYRSIATQDAGQDWAGIKGERSDGSGALLVLEYLIGNGSSTNDIELLLSSPRPNNETRIVVVDSPYLNQIRIALQVAEQRRSTGDLEHAENILLAALVEVERTLGMDAPETIDLLIARAGILKSRGEVAQAEAWLLQALWQVGQTFGVLHELTAVVLLRVGSLAQEQGYREKAARVHRIARRILVGLRKKADLDKNTGFVFAYQCADPLARAVAEYGAMILELGASRRAKRFLKVAMALMGEEDEASEGFRGEVEELILEAGMRAGEGDMLKVG